MKIPNSQFPITNQFPMPKCPIFRFFNHLKIGHWSLIGHWKLVIGYLMLCFVLCSLFFVSIPVFAEEAGQGNPNLGQDITKQMDIAGQQTGLGQRDPRETVARIINVSLTILGVIFLAYTVYAGYLWMTAGGEEEKVTEAKNHLRNGLIGLIIILAALGVMLIVTTYVIRATKFEFYQPPPPYDIIQ